MRSSVPKHVVFSGKAQGKRGVSTVKDVCSNSGVRALAWQHREKPRRKKTLLGAGHRTCQLSSLILSVLKRCREEDPPAACAGQSVWWGPTSAGRDGTTQSAGSAE